MKKMYQAPAIKTLTISHTYHLMQGSNGPRNISGDVTKKGVPVGVAEEINPESLIEGQNGGSLRSREYDDWDDYDE